MVPPGIVTFAARQLPTIGRDLDGAAVRLMARETLLGQPLT